MDSNRPSSRAAAVEVHIESPSNHLPPPPPRGALETSRLRRDVIPPPVLNTAVSLGLNRLPLNTPLTTTTLSSPFAQASPQILSGGPPSRGISPAAGMAGRYNVPYDPRDWSSGVQRVDNSRLQDRDDGSESPPPPYSVPAPALPSQRRPSASMLSPSESNHSSTVSNTPTATVPLSPPSSGHPLRPRSNTPGSGGNVGQGHNNVNTYTPPPPQVPQNVSLTPRAETRQPITPYDPSMPSILPPTARRAVSAGPSASPVSYASPVIAPSTSRSSSQQRSWQPGMPLPGPPPGPPPASQRSQSASSASDKQTDRSTPRARHTRFSLHSSALGPVPPTPADWVEDTPSNAGPPTSLRIDTSNFGARQTTRRSLDTPNGLPSGLLRKTALRDPMAKGILERRSHSRPTSMMISPEHGSDASALSASTNPWAEALANSASAGSTRHDDMDASLDAVLNKSMHNRLPSEQISELKDKARQTSQTSQTPPASPPPRHSHLNLQRMPPPVQTKVLPTPPLSQKALFSPNSVVPLLDSSMVLSPEGQDDFISEAVHRHKVFLNREVEAKSELERLHLFMDYVEEESRVRKERYYSAFESGQFDAAVARERLFADVKQRRASARDSKASLGSQLTLGTTATASVDPAPKSAPIRPETMWWKDYRPALSPIASMDYDEMSSRGRAPSRWWESQTGSTSDGVNGNLRRSKRESKYMSLSKQLLHNMDPVMENLPQLPRSAPPFSTTYPDEKANPESFGFYDDNINHYATGRSTNPNSAALLDISRFITLPPSYPRHYPAVNNNHPDLADFRQAVRTLSDLGEVRGRRSRQKTSIEGLRAERQVKIADARNHFKSNIQLQIEEGSISYSEAAEAEKALKGEEHKIERDGIQAEFDNLQDVVIGPLHDLLNDRVSQLSDMIAKIQNDLFTNAENQDPDRPMEEGDDIPELLEKLTLLKWLFEAREQLHKELYDLLSERNDAYKAIVVLPYQQANNKEKVRGTDEFFQKDAATRYVAYTAESLQRHEAFLHTIEENVQRGVELQSSAFWDLAPMLLELLQKIPRDLDQLAIIIPEDEYVENPSYHDHPQQYLYTLLTHAEKSSYQFIESQINLQCLVHEVKTLHLLAQYRASQAQHSPQNTRDSRLDTSKAKDEAFLTAELKNRAAMIEEQWQESLGGLLHDTRERVKKMLQDQGAWEEMEEQANEQDFG